MADVPTFMNDLGSIPGLQVWVLLRKKLSTKTGRGLLTCARRVHVTDEFFLCHLRLDAVSSWLADLWTDFRGPLIETNWHVGMYLVSFQQTFRNFAIHDRLKGWRVNCGQ